MTGTDPTVRAALVTGASSGLGSAIARDLASDHRVLLGGRDRSRLGGLAAELPDASPWPVDLSAPDEIAAGVADLDRLDTLVHSAGICELGTVANAETDQWRRAFEANVLTVVELTRALLPALRSAGGHVVLINSGAGLRANPGWGSYAASKFALRAFGDALRQEEQGLRVTAVHPGRIDTPMQEGIVASEGREYDASRFLDPATVARAVTHAVRTPADAHPTEIVLRPTGR